jgi:thymidylate synthase (FAD)
MKMSKFYVTKMPPYIELIGVTQPIPSAIERVMEYRDNTWATNPIEGDPLSLVEFGGRVCYESFDNKLNRDRVDYIKDTAIDKEHGSIMEHAWFNLAVLDLPRNALMELTRHRVGVAYSWRSTRYVDNWVGYSVPPLLRAGPSMILDEWGDAAEANFNLYEWTKKVLRAEYPDMKKKQRIEAARSVLWGNCTTDGEFSVNLRSLLHIYKLRSDKGADAMMQEFAHGLYEATKEYTEGLISEH